MTPHRSLSVSLLLAAALVGCAPATQSYQLTVVNESAQPMTIVLTKDGPPMEKDWMPPEDIAMMKNAPADLTVNGITLQPKQKVTQTRTGKFEGGTHATLRVYRGEISMKQMWGVSSGSPNRSDLTLHPGDNTVVIDKTGAAVAK